MIIPKFMPGQEVYGKTAKQKAFVIKLTYDSNGIMYTILRLFDTGSLYEREAYDWELQTLKEASLV